MSNNKFWGALGIAAACGLVVLAGCDSDVCTPGQVLVCECGDGEPGTQPCLSDGTAWDECRCGGGGDADADGDGDTDPGPCQVHSDCDDGIFCNGAEQCVPGDPGADGRGCVSGAGDPCLEGQTCSEADRRCLTDCGETGDADGDGHASLDCLGDDCDDADPNRYPGNVEICDTSASQDSHDEDCDPATLGPDNDGDGYSPQQCCNEQADGALQCGRDCDDGSGSVNPEATEVCNGVDENCDGEVDEGLLSTFYRDVDGDGHGIGSDTIDACIMPAGYADSGGDCDDANPEIHPAALEICDGIDNNCDGTLDPTDCDCTAGETRTCGSDVGECRTGIERCISGRFGPCEGAVTPVAEECDGLDNDCDGDTSDEPTTRYYLDSDRDGYGNPSSSRDACSPPTGYVEDFSDCNDLNGDVHPRQSAWFTSPIPSGHGSGTYDYNCDGVIARQHTSTVCEWDPRRRGCTADVAWASRIPACGESSSCHVCIEFSDTCTPTGTATTCTQGCH